jgi:putative hydrolase of the HAD superfamily
MVHQARALAFDLDGTLWSCSDVIERAEAVLYAWLARHYPRITEAYDREAMRAHRHALAARRPELAADMTALRREALAEHAEQVGYDPALGAQGVAVFLAERQKVTPYPDVAPALERLAGRYPLIALSNGNADVHRTDLAHLFPHALSAAEVGAAKPDPALFRAACERLGVAPGELAHIGDDPHRDIHAARLLGMPTVWVNRHGAHWDGALRRPDHEVADLGELVALLESG